MSDLPPIPPNCPQFFQVREDKEPITFQITDPNEGAEAGAFLDEVPDHWRPIIAAVAEVAWLRAAEDFGGQVHWLEDYPGCAENEEKARQRARDWREWGEAT